MNVLPVSIQNTIGMRKDTDISEIKTTEIGIMDLSSTGSSISKHKIDEAFVIADVIESKLDESKLLETKKEEIELPKKKEEPTELTIDDFIDDFKL